MAERVRGWREHPAGRFATRLFADQRRAARRALTRRGRRPGDDNAAIARPTPSATGPETRFAGIRWRSATSKKR